MAQFLGTATMALALMVSPLYGQKTASTCAIKFSLAERDALGNVNVGFSPDGKKWFEKKVAKNYPDICYAEQKPNEGIWLYISISTQSESSATAHTTTTPDGSGGETSRTTITPSTTTYPVYTLKIGRFVNGNLQVLRTFQRTNAGSAGTMVGFIHGFSNPERQAIVDAIDWMSANEAAITSSAH